MDDDVRLETLAVHAGREADPYGAIVPPVYLSTSYDFDEEKLRRFKAREFNRLYSYSRNANPTQDALQRKLAALEGGEDAIALSSGLAAVSTAIISHVQVGDHVIAAKTVYGGTHSILTQILPRMGVSVTFVEHMDVQSLDAARTPATKLLYLESEYNPTLFVPDVQEIAAWASGNGILTIVDNTFLTPCILRPLTLGASIVVHSTTKYICGHGDQIGGAIIGEAGDIDRMRNDFYALFGQVPSPMACYMTERGLKTLPLRMKVHSQNAMALAAALERESEVDRVVYPGLESHPSHAVALKQFQEGFGGMLALVVKGGEETRCGCAIAKACVLRAALGRSNEVERHGL
jgi:cystathionine beta-lyase/cystathionine gamma-synthase